ncbi:hypothetical protein HispidOSU_029311, partial [Sigmodon hispidus]
GKEQRGHHWLKFKIFQWVNIITHVIDYLLKQTASNYGEQAGLGIHEFYVLAFSVFTT